LLQLLKEREVNVSASQVLPTLRILLKKDKQGVTYLQHLKNALQSEIFGLKSLKEVGDQIPGHNTWQELGYNNRQISLVALNYYVAKALTVLEEAFDHFEVGCKANLEMDNIVRLIQWGTHITTSPYLESLAVMEKGYDQFRPHTIYGIALSSTFTPKGWVFKDIPHPAAIAAVWSIVKTFDLMAKGINDFVKAYKSENEIFKDFVRRIGQSVKAILPKQVAEITGESSDLTEFYRNQVYISDKLLKAIQLSRKDPNASGTISFDDIHCVFRLPTTDDSWNQSLFLRKVDKQGKPEDKLVNFYFNQILTTAKASTVVLEEEEEEEPEWAKVYLKKK